MTTYNFAQIIEELQTGHGVHYQWLNKVMGNPTCIGLQGGHRSNIPFEDKLILEWKVERKSANQPLLDYLEIGLQGEHSQFTDAVQQAIGQHVFWQYHGKGNSDNAILVVRYRDRMNISETETAWVSRVHPLVVQAIRQYINQ